MIAGILTLGRMNLRKLAANLSSSPNQCNTARKKEAKNKEIYSLIYNEKMKFGLVIFKQYIFSII